MMQLSFVTGKILMPTKLNRDQMRQRREPQGRDRLRFCPVSEVYFGV
jgi:hypothetical protein